MSARAARWATGLAVLAVAVIAAVVSFSHIESVALVNGYSPSTGRLLPLSVDGLIVAASMALGTGTRPALARTGLILGILATVAANVAYGAHYGITGAVVNSWPAASFIVASELLLGMLRARPATATQAVTEPVPAKSRRTVAPPPAPTRIDAKRRPDPAKVFAAEIAEGRAPSLRAIKERMHCGTPKAQEIRACLLALIDVPEAA